MTESGKVDKGKGKATSAKPTKETGGRHNKRDQTGKFSSDEPSNTAVEPVILVPASPDGDRPRPIPVPALTSSSEPPPVPAPATKAAPALPPPPPPPQTPSHHGTLTQFGLSHEEVMIAIQQYRMAMNPSVAHAQPNQTWNQSPAIPIQPHIQPGDSPVAHVQPPTHQYVQPARPQVQSPTHIQARLANASHPHMQSPPHHHAQPGAFLQNQPHVDHSPYHPTPNYPLHPYMHLHSNQHSQNIEPQYRGGYLVAGHPQQYPDHIHLSHQTDQRHSNSAPQYGSHHPHGVPDSAASRQSFRAYQRERSPDRGYDYQAYRERSPIRTTHGAQRSNQAANEPVMFTSPRTATSNTLNVTTSPPSSPPCLPQRYLALLKNTAWQFYFIQSDGFGHFENNVLDLAIPHVQKGKRVNSNYCIYYQLATDAEAQSVMCTAEFDLMCVPARTTSYTVVVTVEERDEVC